MPNSEVVTVRIDPALKGRLDALAASTQRSKSWLAAAAIERYVTEESWQISAIAAAIAEADDPQTRWIPGEAVLEWLASWGTENELPAPCA